MQSAKAILLIGALVALPACEQAVNSSAVPAGGSIVQAVSGKRLIVDRGDFIDVGADGELTGMVGPDQSTAISGTWEVRNGQWCRTLVRPAPIAGTACQDATLNGDGTITIVGANGPIVWTIQ